MNMSQNLRKVRRIKKRASNGNRSRSSSGSSTSDALTFLSKGIRPVTSFRKSIKDPDLRRAASFNEARCRAVPPGVTAAGRSTKVLHRNISELRDQVVGRGKTQRLRGNSRQGRKASAQTSFKSGAIKPYLAQQKALPNAEQAGWPERLYSSL